MADIKDFGEYSVKNVKNFMGMDTYGFNCTLYRGKKKVAFCIDDGNGGEVMIDWGTPPRSTEDKAGWEAWRAEKKEEQKLLADHLKTLPKVMSELFPKGLTIDEGWFVSELVNRFEKEKEVRKIQRQCSQKTLFRTKSNKDGAYYIQNAPYSIHLAQAIRLKYGQDVEIFNEVFQKGEVPSIF